MRPDTRLRPQPPRARRVWRGKSRAAPRSPHRRRPVKMEPALHRHLMLLPLALVALLIALPGTASASPRQVVSFEAPRELLDYTKRDRTLDEIRSFGVTRVRQLVYWKDFAPKPNAKRKPRNFNASDPDSYPSGTWGRLDLLVSSAAARGVTVHLNLTGPVPRWATKSKKDHVTRPIPKEFRAW